jgi:ATP-binding cassette subfamily F protein uup
MLEEMLAGYDGTVLIVSHDRAFLDGVATQVLGPLGDGRWAESPGGYADFEREYGGVGARAAKARTAAAAPPPTRAPKPAARKLSYKDARRLEELEGLVPKLEAEIAGIEAQLSDANLALAKPAVFEAAAARLAAARDELDAAETEWLELDALRATLAAGEG